MKVAVWDSYVKKHDRSIMNFDILVEEDMKDELQIFTYGKEYLKSKNIASAELSAKECAFCHIEEATLEVETNIRKKGYHIVEIKNCD